MASGFAGTSAAAPHVAGAAALLKQRAPSASPGQLLSLLQANTVRTAGAGDPGALWLRRPVTGTALVYSQDGQIMVANADASSAHRLLSRVETSAAPAFKPDGTKVAYATSLAGTWQLAVADADGANEQILAASSESGPAWRPDGEKILFTASRGGTPGLFTIDADGTGETRLTSTLAADPDYAPGGSIAFIGATNDVYTANGDGSGVTNLTNGVPSSVNESPAFSPDGSKIAFAATGPVGGEIYVMKADGSEKTRLTNTAAFETDPVWSPDGKITFARRDAGGTDFDLFTMNADGTGQARLLRSPFTADQAPDWAATPPAAPVARKDPAISGEPRAGRWLTATSGSWHARVPFTTSFSWLRCDATGGACTAIPGATDSNHWIGASDVGSTIRVRVTADDGTATGSADSDATPVIAAQAPQNLSLPRISGQATVGSTLTALPGTWSGAPSAFLYQWLRCDVSNGCASIPGATGGAYVPTAGDAGLWLRVAVRAVHTDGLSAGFTVATSLAVTVQAGSPASSPPPPPPPPAPPAAATDAALQVTANAQSIARGDTVTFKLTVVNQHATGVASSVRVSYAIPIGAQLLAWPIQCVGGATFSCELGPLAPQQSTSVELKVRLNELGSTANVFTVTTTESDADPADNQVTVTIVVATKPAARQPRGVRKTGTARRDVLVGTRFDDVLRGLGGNDVLRGLAGNDLLYGGAGSDTVEGGAGNDLLVGGPGRDTIRCGSGKDRVTADRRDRVAKDCERVRR
jgi:dipeptidyl aminopeptidase/acylaminoacyl peptidase